jgi:hypothetical protein
MKSARVVTYVGPACPRCNKPLDLTKVTTDGEDICPTCQVFFEAQVFHPPQRIARVLQLAQAGPEGASSCANHPRNAAVTSCERCGVFVCALCDLDLGGVHYCPSCFDRLTPTGGTDPMSAEAQTRFRDYGTLALGTAGLGFILSWVLIGIPLGALAIYYAIRGFRNRDAAEGRAFALLSAIVIALGDLAIGLGMLNTYLGRKGLFP